MSTVVDNQLVLIKSFVTGLLHWLGNVPSASNQFLNVHCQIWLPSHVLFPGKESDFVSYWLLRSASRTCSSLLSSLHPTLSVLFLFLFHIVERFSSICIRYYKTQKTLVHICCWQNCPSYMQVSEHFEPVTTHKVRNDSSAGADPESSQNRQVFRYLCSTCLF